MRKDNDSTINIRQETIKNHIGASKFSNDDWGTVAYVIPRNQVQDKFAEQELRYNFIYFLIGYEESKELVYVGQAKKRNDGESVLSRLREHDKSNSDRYRDDWSWVVAVTNKEDAWGLDDLNALEYIFYNEIPEDQRLNGSTPNKAGAMLDCYTDKVQQIKGLITAIGFNIFCDDNITKNMQVTENSFDNTVEDLQNWTSKIPEIITPQKVVDMMLDSLPKEIWQDTTKFLDMSCKGGEYLRGIYDRLMDNETMQSKFPNIIERSNHILKNQIYGIALSNVQLERTTKKLLGEDRNIKIIPEYISILKAAYKTKSTSIIRQALNKEFNQEMKFDVIIGNPPYQETTGGGKGGGGNTLYDKFISAGIDMSERYASFVVPARWYTDETRVKSLREKLINTPNMVEIHDFPDTDDLFKGVWIMGGVCYFLWDNQYNGMCRFVEHRSGNIVENIRVLKSDYSDVIIRNSRAISLVEKVLSKKEHRLDEYIFDYNVFKLRSYERGTENKIHEDDIIMYYTGNESRGGGYGYVKRKFITDGTELIDKHKIYINSVSDNMLSFPYKVLYPAFYGAPGTVCTESYLVIGPILDKRYAEPIIKYLKTKFVKALVLQCKTSQTSYKRVYKFVPYQDFTESSDIDWDKSVDDIDKQLYEKYNLQKSEIEYISETIK